MLLRKLLIIAFCAVAAIGIGFYVYRTHAFLVWGLLFLCWACYRLMLRAQSLFGSRQSTASLTGHKGGEIRNTDANG